jgi:hypothetical protein
MATADATRTGQRRRPGIDTLRGGPKPEECFLLGDFTLRKRISVVLATAALGAAVGATAFASPSLAYSSGCTTRAEGSLGGSAYCTKMTAGSSQAVQVSCRRATNGRAYTNTGKYVKNKVRSYAYCSSGDYRTGIRSTIDDIVLQ